jgi:hypothetical protein
VLKLFFFVSFVSFVVMLLHRKPRRVLILRAKKVPKIETRKTPSPRREVNSQ